ncbi:MAG: ATP-binding cassette domain-containing protein [Micromonosporaceae bacterium]|nr:ATP-binding cassette domain-containing protein [Micromonosporaceae bacterium]
MAWSPPKRGRPTWTSSSSRTRTAWRAADTTRTRSIRPCAGSGQADHRNDAEGTAHMARPDHATRQAQPSPVDRAGGGQPLVTLENLTFGYPGGETILEDLDLRVRQGEFLALLGPSGCGKTTIMNLVAGFVRPRQGTVVFDGAPLRGINTRVGYMTQGDTLLPWRTVAKNVQLPLEIRATPRARANQLVDSYLGMLHLSDARDRFPSELSGGMKRRALLARSLIYEPAMLLMDEPFAALDAQLREALHRELLSTVAQLRQTVMFVTHDISESILLADRVIVLGTQPAGILAEVVIPFGADRDLAEIRLSNEYLGLERKVRDLLRQ